MFGNNAVNMVIITGRLTKDVELRHTATGKAVASMTVAVGKKEGSADFFDVVAWEKHAELCSQYLSKGSPVMVEGRLQNRSWEAQDGSKRTKTEIVANRVRFGPKSNGQGQAAAAANDTSNAGGFDMGGFGQGDEDDVPF